MKTDTSYSNYCEVDIFLKSQMSKFASICVVMVLVYVGCLFCMGAYKHEVVVSGALKWLLNKGFGCIF